MKKGRLFYGVGVERSHGLEFTFNTLPSFHTPGSTRCGFFSGQMVVGLQRLKEEVSVSPVPRRPLQFIRVQAAAPPGSGLCSGGGREMEKACQAQKAVPADPPS